MKGNGVGWKRVKLDSNDKIPFVLTYIQCKGIQQGYTTVKRSLVAKVPKFMKIPLLIQNYNTWQVYRLSKGTNTTI